ncbi:MAG TPA: hypothetical protein VEB21_13255, partial [Terriglobales bacterium]|nr:hypothetical protein [Terriglobales bacterium]
MFISVKGQGVFRYPRAALQAQGISSDDNADSNGTAGSFLYYDSEALASSTSLLDARGAAVFGNQIVLADRDRLMIWNSFDGANFEIGGSSLVSGFAADSVFGQTTLATSVKDSESHLRPYFSAPKLVKKTSGDELWVYRRRFDDLLKFAGPISPTSQPGIELLPVSRTGRQPYCLCGGGPCNMSMQAMTSPLFNADEFDFAVDANGGATHVWFADRFNNRVFRVRDFETSSKCVDVVLGQPNATAMSCNRGQASPSNASLCVPYNVSLDDDGSLYVADNGDEGGTNHRILQWDAHHFDVPSTKCPTTPCYAPTADRVIGTGGSFSIAGDATTAGDPFLSPYGSAFSGIGHMATINNPFPELSSRFATVFANPIAVQVPQLVLGDYLSNPRFTPHFDTKGNLLVPDANNGRTLVYDKPLAVAECLERKCVGDCNVDCSVTADEIITTISASLGEVSLDSCRYGDSTRDGAITVEEIIQSVGSSLEGCGLALPPASSTTANLEVWPASGTRGSFVTIIVVLEDGQTEVSGANFDFNFPTNVMTAPVCSIAGTMMPTGHELNTSDPEPGCHRAVIMDSDDYPIATVADGPIIACQTQILASAPYGTHQISLSRANLSDAYGNEVLCGTAAGTLTVNTGSGGGCQTTESGG